jgi:hypothetical protein
VFNIFQCEFAISNERLASDWIIYYICDYSNFNQTKVDFNKRKALRKQSTIFCSLGFTRLTRFFKLQYAFMYLATNNSEKSSMVFATASSNLCISSPRSKAFGFSAPSFASLGDFGD